MRRQPTARFAPDRPPSPVGGKELVRRFFDEVLARRSARAADELIAPGAVVQLPTGRFAGPAGVKRASGQLGSAFPDLRVEVEELVAEGDRVAARWILRGTQRRELLGVPPTGRPTAIAGRSLFRLEGGKIVEHRMTEG